MKRPRGFPKAEWRRMRSLAAIEFRPPIANDGTERIPALLAKSAAHDAACLATIERLIAERMGNV